MSRKKKPTLTLLYGPPGAGKTTKAKRMAAEDPEHTIMISRDTLRESLGNYWVESREPLVKKMEKQMAGLALQNEYSVVLDNTNVDFYNNRDWRNIAELCGAKFAFVPVIATKEECKIRNRCKGRKVVPEEFIDLWFDTYVNEDGTLKTFDELKDCEKI